MKISKNLPQFKENSGAILVISGLKAKYIFMADGLAGEWNNFQEEAKEPKSKEGRFETRKGGKVIRSGGVYEDTKDLERVNFIKKLKAELKRDKDNFLVAKDLYIFCPEQFYHFLLEEFPKPWQEKIKLIIKGDYYSRHLFELLETISLKLKAREVEIAPPPLAAKVLNKTTKIKKQK